ncbi:hypothetical protein JWJ90_16980 [Desulfobulbus rhabdoformis]|jgi:hypothetical protein|uniref:hypothetical protein n=1 Tax=Desulfobulbus rhabdoformis TaxID=34032 RepID=UPI001962D783|nr:hypothetical protein [Desulfobulbus rhabdoformis]MBM9615965.1 hypothetical protein [Desulfobulbus rhabdoformis]
MSILKNLGKSLLIAGIVMLFAAPVMAKGPQGGSKGVPDLLCSCCEDGGVSSNPLCPCYEE